MSPSSIDESQVRHVAHLARLALTDDEVLRMSRDLSTMIDFVDSLGEVNTDQVPPTDHPFDAANSMRADEITASLGTSAVLSNAPRQYGDCFQVPRVLDQDRDG